MNNWIYLGKIVNTHGIKGELRIKSDFDKKRLVFWPNVSIYIGNEKKEEKIKTYRQHKNFDMVTFFEYTNINEVLKYMKEDVYIKRNDLNLSATDYLRDDLIGCTVIENDKILGKIINVVYNKAGTLLQVEQENKKTFYIPHHTNFIVNVNMSNKTVETQNGQDLIL